MNITMNSKLLSKIHFVEPIYNLLFGHTIISRKFMNISKVEMILLKFLLQLVKLTFQIWCP